MTWALWLAVPVGATALAALWAWWRGYRVRRAGRPLGTEAAVRAHSEYLDALTIPAPQRRASGAHRGAGYAHRGDECGARREPPGAHPGRLRRCCSSSLLILTMTLPVPYVVLSPGPTCNTLSTCPGETRADHPDHRHADAQDLRQPEPDHGQLLDQQAHRVRRVARVVASDEAVVPRSAMFPPGQTTQQVNTENTNEFSASQDSAVVAAACELGYKKAFGVLSVVSKGASRRRPAVRVTCSRRSTASRPTPIARLKAILAAEQPGTVGPGRRRAQHEPDAGTTKTLHDQARAAAEGRARRVDGDHRAADAGVPRAVRGRTSGSATRSAARRPE